MIRYIKLKNFKSFTDITFDFTGKNNMPKPVIIIYGENGAGKTNIIKTFHLLQQSLVTMQIKNIIMNFLENPPEKYDTQKLQFLATFSGIEACIKEYKTIGSIDNMLLEIGFLLNEKEGKYLIEFSNTQIIHERLEYSITKNKGIYFDIVENNHKINPSIFGNDYLSDIKIKLKKFWGKHSLLSILYYDIHEFSDQYIDEQISDNLKIILEYFTHISCHTVEKQYNQEISYTNIEMLEDLTSGTISADELGKLRNTELTFRNFFINTYKDIIDVNYRLSEKEGKIKYELFFHKMINGNVVEISYQEESCGTQSLINLLPYFIAATNPGIVAIDEIDNGIHDILMNNIFENLVKQNRGQLIITTHNSSFLSNYDYKDYIYFVNITEDGTRQFKALTDFNFRIQRESNTLARYIKGEFNGVPWNEMNINFQDLLPSNEE